ncbi:Phage portal protein, lambda family [Gemmata obscuriglobus]|uniref:ParB/Sulfiredoxin domain-containing protein n=1 Tax=Gemmata obscuriglobus TaxID=114 RepID=A0A2Z3HFL0_9BACT|nr:hypothetical protein [Gemmata obscuriglobus]AWM41755.1 hypothetical protein C1280_35340 [Gemmata obscuriglobus]QEG32291.1 Phage portal protein, lambda family [Gemmata obscuriglobus]VTS11647.1 portal protein lambda : DNA repair protein OS=delta proteobacterium NaphS2 GN=radC PE=3 SV=1: Phage_portal_2 [Gemmata obscuriglobus UQM 2246]
MYPAAITLSVSDHFPGAPAVESASLAQLKREHAAKVRRLEETLLSLDNLLSPQDWLDAGDGFPGYGSWRVNRPAQRTQDRTKAPLSYLNEDEWRQHVALARDLCIRNHLALGFRDHISNFVGSMQLAFVPRRRGDAQAEAVAKACLALWEEWCEFAEWGQGEEDREEECRRRLIVEGETTLRFFVGDDTSDGLPYVRHIEPELIRTPDGHSTLDPFGWGVITAEGDDEREEGLWLCDPANVSRGRQVASSEYVRMKANVDRTVKRGLSDFFPVGEQLRKVLGLLDNMAHVARVQAAIAWWEQYPNATLDQVINSVRMGEDYSRVKPAGNPGSSTSVTGYEAGTVVRTEGGREVKPGPVSSGTAGFETVERLVLKGVGFRWGCPSYFSGEGDASFASVLVTGSPFVRLTQGRQERVKAFACRVATRVLEFCERSGRLARGTSKRVKPVATAGPVVIADEEKKARTFLSLYQQKCASPLEFMRSTGAEPDQVAKDIAEWQAKFPDQGGGGLPPASPPPGAPPAPTDPTSTPPGSAGGDGSSPNPTDIFGEQILREKFTGDITDAAGRKRHYVDGKQVAQPQAGNSDAGTKPSADGTVEQVPDQDRADITGGIDQAVAALPEAERPAASVVAKAKDVALTAAAKTYIWAVKVANSPKTAALGSLLADIFDTPSDLGKLGYNPNTSSGTANPRNADFVSANLADTIGVGISGHLVASIASKLIVKAGAWAAGQVRGRAEAVETDGVNEWAEIIAELLAHLHEQLGVQAPTPDAATVEQGLRSALAEQSEIATEAKSEGETWQGDSGRWFTLKKGHVVPAPAPQKDTGNTSRAPSAAVLKKHPTADKQYLNHLAEAAPTQDVRDYLETAAWNVPGEQVPLSPEARRHATVERLAAVHRDAIKDGKPEVAEHLANVIRWFGGTFEGPEAGQTTKFDGALYHTADGASAWTGDAVVVVRQPVRGPDRQLAIKGLVKTGHQESVASEHIGRTAEGHEWVSEALYALLSTEARAGLTLMTITDRNGNQVKRWVRAGVAQNTQPQQRGADHVVSRALADPSSLSAADVKALADHAAGLSKEDLRALNLEFRQKIGGSKAALASRLVEHVRQQGAQTAPAAPANAPPKPGEVRTVPTHELKVDPGRFQFKLNTNNPAGVTKELEGVKSFNPEFAGVVSVWRDPADGETYIVNGHHRHELAARTGHPDLAVRYLQAKDAREARAKGALINIAEGRGTAVDAAKFMRDMGVSPADLEKHGVSLKGKLAEDAATMTKLNDKAFDRVARGTLEPEKALAVAKHLDNPDRQEKLFKLLDKREESGKDLSNRTVEELARQMAAVPAVTTVNSTLWGDEESEDDTFVERAELAGHVRSALAQELNDFRAVASTRRAGRVADAGNSLNTDENRRRAQELESHSNTYDLLANRKGAISDALDAGAVQMKKAKTKKEKDRARAETLENAKKAIRSTLDNLTRRPGE